MAAFTVTKAPGFCMAGERLCIAEGRSPMEVGRRKKEEAIKLIVSAINNVLTVLAVAINHNSTLTASNS